MLGVIRQAFDTVMVEQTSDEVLRLVGAFAHAVRQVHRGRRDRSAAASSRRRSAYDDLNTTRRRALERPLVKIDELRRDRGLAASPDLAAGADVLELTDGRVDDYDELGA